MLKLRLSSPGEPAREACAQYSMTGIYLITGDGAGKTTSSLGMAMRTIGHGKKAVMIQFMKFWKSTGEYILQDSLKPLFEVHQFGRPHWLNISEGEKKYGEKAFKTEGIEEDDRAWALKGLKKAEEVLVTEKPHLLILDEICLATNTGLLTVKEVLALLDKMSPETTLVMTGRRAPQELQERADFVNTVMPTKYPQKYQAQEGIQY